MLKEEADTTNWIKVIKQLFFTFFNNLFILSNSLGTFSLSFSLSLSPSLTLVLSRSLSLSLSHTHTHTSIYREICAVLGLVTQSCPTLSDAMDCSPPGSSVQGILQARILEWVAMSSSRGSSQPRDQTQVSCTAGGFFTIWATREAIERYSHSLF